MYKFAITPLGLETTYDGVRKEVSEFFQAHCACDMISPWFEVPNRISHIVWGQDGETVIGLIPIIQLTPYRDGDEWGEITSRHFQLYYTVVHTDYRGQGLSYTLLRAATHYLFNDYQADKVRVGKSCLNNVKPTVFTEVKYNVIHRFEEDPEYKDLYEVTKEHLDHQKLNQRLTGISLKQAGTRSKNV